MNIQDLKKRYGIQYDGRFVCPICGQDKTHYRLYGYRCSNLEHHQREDEFTKALVDALLDRKISQDEYDQYCFGDTQ